MRKISDTNNRKGQIGATLTWLVAFTIVFFMLLIFVGGSALLALKKSVPSVSESNPNGKSNELTFTPIEPKGSDFGDLSLQREIISFMNQQLTFEGGRGSVSDLVKSFDSSIYNNVKMMSDDEIKSNENMRLFYETAVDNFDRMYGDCYVLCLEFRSKSGSDFNDITGNQVIIGKECSPKREDIYGRARTLYRCYASVYNVDGSFNYAKVELYPEKNDGRVVAVKMLKGGLVTR